MRLQHVTVSVILTVSFTISVSLTIKVSLIISVSFWQEDKLACVKNKIMIRGRKPKKYLIIVMQRVWVYDTVKI